MDMDYISQQQLADNITRMANYRKHAEQLAVPVLTNSEIIGSKDPHVVMFAVKDNVFIEQLISDGHIEDGQFEQRIELAINNEKRLMKEENVDLNFMYYKDYDNGVFKFKLYVCDMIKSDGDGKKGITRIFYAYFVEPRLHDFYALTVSAGVFPMPTEQLKPGTIDLQNDKITISLDNLMKMLMDNLKYKYR